MTQLPPPLPPGPPIGSPAGPIPYSNLPSPPQRPGFYQQAAKASCVAPLLAIVLGLVTTSMRDQNRSVGVTVGGVNALLLVAGLVLGLIALIARIRGRARDVLVPSICGIIFNGIFLTAIVWLGWGTYLRANARPVAAGGTTRSPVAAAMGRDDKLAFETDAGWIGTYGAGGRRVIMASAADDTNAARTLASIVNRPISVMILSIDNSAGSEPIDVDTSDGFLVLESKQISFIAARNVGPTEDRETFIRRFSPPFAANGGMQLQGAPIFIPRGTDLRPLRSIEISVNGQRVNVSGRWYTAEEKQDLVRRSRNGAAPASAPSSRG